MKKVVLLLSLVVATPVAARDFGTYGGFTVGSTEADPETAEGGFCGMMKDGYEGAGSSRLMVFRYLKYPDSVAAVVDNYNWSTVKDKEYEVKYHLGGYYYERTAIGTEDSIRKGLMAIFPASDFLPTFAKADGFKVTMNDITVDNLSLTGSGAAVDAFNRCWQYIRADQAVKQARRDRFKHIPKDPFK
jgi:hypothetical protein